MLEQVQRRLVRLLLRQGGFTLVEVLVASILMTVGLLATIAVLDSANHANSATQRHQTATGLAQRALEELDNLRYDQLALTADATSSGDANLPSSRVNGNLFMAQTGVEEELVVGGESAAVASGPETINEGSTTAEVYRYVTWVDAPSFQGCEQNCNSTQDYKRVTVAVRANNANSAGFKRYVIVSSLRVDPLLGPEGQVTQPPDPNPTEAHDNFYLYDTRNLTCSDNVYNQPSGDHATHDTRGTCGGGQDDYPDLMDVMAPPNPAEPDLPPLYTYSNDLVGSYSGGLAIERASDHQAPSDCSLDDLTKYQIHSWVSDPVSDSAYQLTGKISFDFWSAAVGATSGEGKICTWLYDRAVVDGVAEDTLIAGSSYRLTNWPDDSENLSFTFSHDPYTLPAGHHLRFVLTVSSESDADLQFIYDHPSSPSFVQVRTTTPISE